MVYFFEFIIPYYIIGMQMFDGVFYLRRMKIGGVAHPVTMKKNLCSEFENFGLDDEIYECVNCGNHVCKTCALMWNGVCPHCFSRLYRIS